MKNCKNLYLLSALACQLADCMDENELEILDADLNVLSDMISAILARESNQNS